MLLYGAYAHPHEVDLDLLGLVRERFVLSQKSELAWNFAALVTRGAELFFDVATERAKGEGQALSGKRSRQVLPLTDCLGADPPFSFDLFFFFTLQA